MVPEPPGRPTSPAPPEPWHAYLDLVVVGYVLYGVGAISPFVRDLLTLSDAETGLHSSALAIGFVVAGLSADRIDRLAGGRRGHVAGLLALAGGCLALAWAPALAVTLAAAASVGLGAGILIGHVNFTLGAPGGARSRLWLVRANFLSICAALMAPIAIGLAVTAGLGWQAALLPAVILLLLALGWVRRQTLGAGLATTAARGRLPRGFWLAWLLLVLSISIEFAVVFWGSTLVARRSGTDLAAATLTGSLFLAGMVVGRLVFSWERAGTRDPLLLVRLGLVLALGGSVAAWISTTVPLGGAGLFLCGLGVAVLYPLCVSLALVAARERAGQAAARLVLASGAAILLAPLVLGALADAYGVAAGWALVPATCLAALALSLPVAREVRGREPSSA